MSTQIKDFAVGLQYLLDSNEELRKELTAQSLRVEDLKAERDRARTALAIADTRLDEVLGARDDARVFQSKVIELLWRVYDEVQMPNPLGVLESLVLDRLKARREANSGTAAPICGKAPPPWRCTRDQGHEGPRAAHSKLCVEAKEVINPAGFDKPSAAPGVTSRCPDQDCPICKAGYNPV